MLDPKKIKSRREKIGLSVTEAAGRANLLRPNWSRIERGENTDTKLSTAISIARALRCPVTKLIKE